MPRGTSEKYLAKYICRSDLRILVAGRLRWGGGECCQHFPGGGGGGTADWLARHRAGPAPANNVVNAIVDQGPSRFGSGQQAAVNIMYVKVTVCVPGSTTTCQTIDHVQVDTGSQGLRILARC